MKWNPFAQFEQALTDEQLSEFQQRIRKEGFTGFRLFLEGFRERMKAFEDRDLEPMEALIERAKQLFPEPSDFSPSWVKIWDDFEQMISYKRLVFETIGPAEREGEWQIIIDNPYTHQEIVCYPGLSFLEGAFLYAYFRTDLKQNEYIRLQKIQNVIMAFGSERPEQREKSKGRD
ncbi:hypothetical protein O9H85_27060 [Paenibacillus filicis]|uniref:Uncharacterized protein n=1 Tax=Paenibacillus gyeongsangnamensis TaxID=3388067 RepID=A0ABT4QH23_9BACL|nr:hypothetical protein [Paenibacillus filicis]MCZ8515995.1 hypothetical protein [Paenibacillus filicis]